MALSVHRKETSEDEARVEAAFSRFLARLNWNDAYEGWRGFEHALRGEPDMKAYLRRWERVRDRALRGAGRTPYLTLGYGYVGVLV